MLASVLQRSADEEGATLGERLQSVLMDEADLRLRARAHLELARLSLAEGKVEGSVRHLREALMLDVRLDAARQMLQDLGEASRVAEAPGDRRGAVRALLSRLRRN